MKFNIHIIALTDFFADLIIASIDPFHGNRPIKTSETTPETTDDGNPRAPRGRVTGYVANELRVGDTVRVSGPMGSAYLRRQHTGPMLWVAGGTGMAPILSIVRGVVAAGMGNPIHLYFGVRSERDIYGVEWLRALQRQHPQLQVHIVVASGPAQGHRTGLVTDAIAWDWRSLEGFRAYLCGAPPMVEATALQVRQMGVLPEQVYADAFYAIGT